MLHAPHTEHANTAVNLDAKRQEERENMPVLAFTEPKENAELLKEMSNLIASNKKLISDIERVKQLELAKYDELLCAIEQHKERLRKLGKFDSTILFVWYICKQASQH